MFTFSQSTGIYRRDGSFVGTGYSGIGAGRNDGAMENVEGVGPIPKGRYRIGAPYDDEHLGPCVMHLDPEPGTNTFGRSLFRVHGDNAAHSASHGCIILGPVIRRAIAASGDHELEVTA